MTSRTRKNASTKASVDAPPSSGDGFQLISSGRLLELYSGLLKCRMIAERTHLLIDKKELKASRSVVVGREAATVGVVLGLLPADLLASSQYEPGLAFIKGVPLHKIFAQLTARRQTSAAARLKAVLAAARTRKVVRGDRIAVFVRNAAGPAEALWGESLRQAGAERLPILFITYHGAEAEDATLKAERYGFPVIPVDGNDVVAVYRVATESIAHARRGNGPTLIECVPWGLSGPEPDDAFGNMERYLCRKGLYATNFKADVASGFSRELDAALRRFYLNTRPSCKGALRGA